MLQGSDVRIRQLSHSLELPYEDVAEVLAATPDGYIVPSDEIKSALSLGRITVVSIYNSKNTQVVSLEVQS